MSVALLLLATAGTFAADLDQAVTAVVSDLHLSSVDGFDLGADLAVVVDLSKATDGAAVAPLIRGIVNARLEQLGAQVVLAVPPGGDVDGRARRWGAEWVLEVRGDRVQRDELRLFAQLRRVDRGLWLPPPNGETTAIYALAETKVRVSAEAAPPPPPVEPPPPPTESKDPELAGPAVAIGSVPERAVALAACRMTETDTDQLVVVTERSVIVYAYDRRRLRRLAKLDLSAYPTAASPVREPIGAVTCGPELGGRRVVGVGTSNLERGYVLSLASKRRGRYALAVEHELPGTPLGRMGDDWIVGWPNEGTNVWSATLARQQAANTRRFEVRPTYSLHVDGGRWWAVSTGYDLLFGSAGLEAPQVVGKAGAALAALQEPALLVHTSPTLTDGADTVTLRAGSNKPTKVRVRAPVQALAIGRFRTGRTDVVASVWRPRQQDTELFVIGVSGVEAPE